MRLSWTPKRSGDGPVPRVFLSASVPRPDRNKVYLEGPLEERLMLRVIETRVQDAVSSLVAHVLGAGGQVIFGGHPAITPMVAATASSFAVDGSGEERPILLYQSEHFRKAVPPVGRLEMERAGLSRTIWVPENPAAASKEFPSAKDWLFGERFEKMRDGQADPKANKRRSDALAVFRIVMLADSRPDAAVSMGGMEGVEAEAMLYHTVFAEDKSRQLFALGSTFGAAERLGELGITAIDEEYFESRKEIDPSARGVALHPVRKHETIRRQLLQRMQYDGMMEQFVSVVRDRSLKRK